MADRHIVCFGNELHGDDGFGIGVYARLQQAALPNDVDVFNAGIAGLNALRFLENCQQAILVDALTNFGEVGEVCILRPEELATGHNPFIGHGLGIPYLLEALKTIRSPLPEILIVGVEIAELKSFSPGLSAKTEQAISETIRLILSILS